MTGRRSIAAALLVLVASGSAVGGHAVASPAPLSSGVPTRLSSVTSPGVQANGTSYGPSISANGRYVVFSSTASNLIPGDTAATVQVFVRDLRQGVTRLVSVGLHGVTGDAASYAAAISADGRYVVFDSNASNLVAGDVAGTRDVFVRDLANQVTTRVSVSSSGESANGRSDGGSISADDRHVAFVSDASNLVREDTNGTTDVFVRSLDTAVTRRASVGSHGRQADGYSYLGSISANGRLVVFRSDAPNLVTGDTNHRPDIFVRDRKLQVTRRVSVSSSGRQSNLSSYDGSISADGRFVAFSSFGSNLVPGDTNNRSDIFVRDRKNHVTRRVTVSVTGGQTHISTSGGSISADGRYVVFGSRAANLVPGDTFDGTYDIFVSNTKNHVIRRVSVSSTGVAANDSSFGGVLSADGRYVAFQSDATNLVTGDTNDASDIFVRDRENHLTLRVSVG